MALWNGAPAGMASSLEAASIRCGESAPNRQHFQSSRASCSLRPAAQCANRSKTWSSIHGRYDSRGRNAQQKREKSNKNLPRPRKKRSVSPIFKISKKKFKIKVQNLKNMMWQWCIDIVNSHWAIAVCFLTSKLLNRSLFYCKPQYCIPQII